MSLNQLALFSATTENLQLELIQCLKRIGDLDRAVDAGLRELQSITAESRSAATVRTSLATRKRKRGPEKLDRRDEISREVELKSQIICWISERQRWSSELVVCSEEIRDLLHSRVVHFSKAILGS